MANADGVNNQQQVDIYNVNFKKDLKPKDSEKAISLFNALYDEVKSILSNEADANHDGIVDKNDLLKLRQLKSKLIDAALNIYKYFDKYMQHFDAKDFIDVFRSFVDDIASVISDIERGRYTSPKEEREKLRAEQARKEEEARKAEEERMAKNNSDVKESGESDSAKKNYAYIDKKADNILSNALAEDKQRIKIDQAYAFNPTYYDRKPLPSNSALIEIKELYMNNTTENGRLTKVFSDPDKAQALINWANLQLDYGYINEKQYYFLANDAHQYLNTYYGIEEDNVTDEDDAKIREKLEKLGSVDHHGKGFWSNYGKAVKAGGYSRSFEGDMEAIGYSKAEIERMKKENGIK